MVTGVFNESDGNPHVRLRNALLDGGRPLPSPSLAPVALDAESLSAALERDGAALAAFDAPPSDEDLIARFERLGTPIIEHDPAVQPFVGRGVVLNLVTEYGHTGDICLQPFATNGLTLHTESSRRPLAQQPRYIVLACCHPGDASAQALTVLVPMDEVAARLDDADRSILAQTSYRTPGGVPPILRMAAGGPVFSFRDFAAEGFEWVSTAPHVDAAAVNGAIGRMLAAMYGGGATAVRWSEGLVAVIDNFRFFHGRTSGRAGQPSRPRHLKRLRLL